MYLVHAYLRSGAGRNAPDATRLLIAHAAEPADGLEHVVVHPFPYGNDLTIGMFILATSLVDAERVAHDICIRVLGQAEFRGFSLLLAQVPLPWAVQSEEQFPGDCGPNMSWPDEDSEMR